MLSHQAGRLLGQLIAEGVSPWLAVEDGEALADAVRRRLLGDAFQAAVVPPGTPVPQVRLACDALLPLFTAGGGRGQVSVPVDPRLADRAGALLAGARALHAAVRRPNVLVRLPMTAAGRAVMTELLADGIGVHASLVLSEERCADVLDAYVEGMERALAAGVRLGDVLVAVSCPVGLLDAEADARLARSGATPAALPDGTAGRALARLLFRLREQRLAGDWWRVLRADGALPPRLLWTGGRAEDAAGLVGSNTALALSPQELERAARLGPLRGDTLLGKHLAAREAFTVLERLGVDLGEAAAVAEHRELERLRHGWELRTAVSS